MEAIRNPKAREAALQAIRAEADQAEDDWDWEAQETVRCHDCGAPATGTGTCAHARHDCTGGVDLCTACGTSELHVDDWTPDVV